MAELQYESLRQVTPLAGVVLAENPNMMTLDGTNTWILRDDPRRREAIVIDPGPDDEKHLDAIFAAAGTIHSIVLTHGHSDHSASLAHLHELTGAPVYALDPTHRYGTEGLTEGDVLDGAGVSVKVWRTPGHTADSLCLMLPATDADAAPSAVLTGDTILGRGTAIISHPDGVLGDYLDSLHRLAALTGIAVLPGHGPELSDAGAIATWYLAHRRERLDQVRTALAGADGPLSARQVVEIVYVDVDRALWPAAEASVRAQLEYLEEERAAGS